jgi:hypothetical protein
MSPTILPLTDADNLVHVVAPTEPTLPEASARSLLELRFDDKAVQRMNELAEKCGSSQLTDAERNELESFQRVGHLLNLLQAKARLSLAQRTGK